MSEPELDYEHLMSCVDKWCAYCRDEEPERDPEVCKPGLTRSRLSTKRISPRSPCGLLGLIFVFLAMLVGLCFLDVAIANAAPPTVYIVNKASAVTDTELQNWIPVLQAQISGEFEQTWNIDATVSLSDAPPAGSWTITIADRTDAMGVLGYHDVCNTDGHNGVPCGFVYAQTTIDDGEAVSKVVDHELLEMLADPYTTTMEKVGTRFYIREVCDSPESDANAYIRQGPSGPVLLSDFVTPFFFRPGHYGPYDFMGHVKWPLQVLPGGYISWWANGSWHQRSVLERSGHPIRS